MHVENQRAWNIFNEIHFKYLYWFAVTPVHRSRLFPPPKRKSIYLKHQSNFILFILVHIFELTVKMSPRVKKKNFIPDNATVSLAISSENRWASRHHECGGIVRKAYNGFFDSSWTFDAYNETASVRKMRKLNENQKYTLFMNDGIGLKLVHLSLNKLFKIKIFKSNLNLL